MYNHYFYQTNGKNFNYFKQLALHLSLIYWSSVALTFKTFNQLMSDKGWWSNERVDLTNTNLYKHDEYNFTDSHFGLNQKSERNEWKWTSMNFIWFRSQISLLYIAKLLLVIFNSTELNQNQIISISCKPLILFEIIGEGVDDDLD